MLIVQHNCVQRNERIIMEVKTALNIKADILIVQEFFIDTQKTGYIILDFNYLQAERNRMKFMISV